MSCEACIAAEMEPRTDRAAPGCPGCAGRLAACLGILPDDYRRSLRGAVDRADRFKAFEHWAGVLRRARVAQQLQEVS